MDKSSEALRSCTDACHYYKKHTIIEANNNSMISFTYFSNREPVCVVALEIHHARPWEFMSWTDPAAQICWSKCLQNIFLFTLCYNLH